MVKGWLCLRQNHCKFLNLDWHFLFHPVWLQNMRYSWSAYFKIATVWHCLNEVDSLQQSTCSYDTALFWGRCKYRIAHIFVGSPEGYLVSSLPWSPSTSWAPFSMFTLMTHQKARPFSMGHTVDQNLCSTTISCKENRQWNHVGHVLPIKDMIASVSDIRRCSMKKIPTSRS